VSAIFFCGWLLRTFPALLLFHCFLPKGNEGSHSTTTAMVAHTEADEGKDDNFGVFLDGACAEDKDVDFGVPGNDNNNDDDVPALLSLFEAITIDSPIQPDDDECINSGMDNVLAKEDGVLGLEDDHIIEDNLEDLDEHAAKW
jgi:hypothetical protein